MQKPFEWLPLLHVWSSIMAKVVQTDLEEDEYMLFTELLHKQRLSIREGLRLAVNRMVKEGVKLDSKDPLLNRKLTGRSGLGNRSKRHDEYLCGRRSSRDSSSPPAELSPWRIKT